MTDTTLLLAATIGAALVFDFMNGFHDSANAIATVVGTRVLSPLKAVTLAAIGNFVAFTVFPLAVAATIAKGIVDQKSLVEAGSLGLVVIFAGLLAAFLWDALTWLFGLPTSSSHALIGGILGATVAAFGLGPVLFPDPVLVSMRFSLSLPAGLAGAAAGLLLALRLGSPRVLRYVLLGGFAAWVSATALLTLTGAARPSGLFAVLVYMVASPLLGMGMGFLMVSLVRRAFRGWSYSRANRVFGRLQLASATFFSLNHGANDGQKTIAGAASPADHIPFWVILSASAAISIGTFFGGWRIIKTMGFRMTHLRPYEGFSAETGGGAVLSGMAWAGIPVSTTHAISAAIMGVGMTRGFSAVRWGIARNIVWAWILTIPACFLLAAGFLLGLRAVGIG